MSALPTPGRPRHPPAQPLEQLTQVVADAVFEGEPAAGRTVTGITHDSRAVRPGDLYAALPGSRVHGAAYAGAAARAGAVGVLTDVTGRDLAGECGLPVVVVPDPRAVLGTVAAWVYARPAADLLVLGVTGTNGKTTTTYLLDAGLRAAGHTTGLIGTIETRVADSVVPSVRTTPEATDLQALFARMREDGVSAVAMEVSSHALALGRVDGTRYAAAAFTNLSQDHLDFHADLDDYFEAKARLFTPALTTRGVVNVGDRWGRRLAERAGIPMTTYRVDPPPGADAGWGEGEGAAHWCAQDIDTNAAGSRFRLLGPGVDVAAAVRLPGLFNVGNAVAALVLLVVAGVPLEAALHGVAALPGVPGRMERVDVGQPFLAIVDYAHTAEAVATLLTTLRPATEGRLVVVLGCGGDRDRAKRPGMGASAVRGADLAIFTIDNPRGEDPAAILEQMLAGAREAARAGATAEVVVEPDRAAAIALAVSSAGPGDTVVVAGKGHEQGQELAGGQVVAFDDRAVLRAALAGARA